MSSSVPTYFPYEAQHWNEYPADVQAQINAAAQAQQVAFNAQFNTIRSEGGCDATKPGRLAGALREKLVQAGGKLSTSDESVFGPAECAEWWKVFGKPPELADALSVSAASIGSAKYDINTICYGKILLPNCPKPATPAPAPAPAPAPVIVPTVSAPAPVQKANMLVTGGIIAAVFGGGYYYAKKKGLIK